MKLVRDRIGDIPWPDEESKQRLGYVPTGTPEHRALLVAKLREEVEELVRAFDVGTPQEVLEEAADVYEVLLGIVAADGIGRPGHPGTTADALSRAELRKFNERGGFFRGRTYAIPESADE